MRTFALVVLLAACATEKPRPMPTPGSSERPRIYQLLVRTFGNTNATNARAGTLAQNGCGHFADLDATALGAIRELGATHVWLTGMLRHASLTAYPELGLPAEDPDVVKGLAGSPFAIMDAFDVSPDLALDPAHRLDEFRALVTRAHAAGLRVILDLVPNHVARGYGSLSHAGDDLGTGEDPTVFFARDNAFFHLVEPAGQVLRLHAPEGWTPPGLDGRYAREDGSTPARTPRATGNNVTSASPGAGDWYETVKLNWGFNFVTGETAFEPRPRTWTVFDRILRFWQGFGVDGFRADMAHWIPAEAWKWLLAEARARDPHVTFLAEAYPGSDHAPGSTLEGLVAAGFDGVYDSTSYQAAKAVLQGSGSAADLAQAASVPRDRAVRYVENHDERRAASPLAPPGQDSGFGSGEAGFAAAAALFLSGGGPVLVHAGQELAEPGAGVEGFGGEDGRTSIFDYWSIPTVRALHAAGWNAGALPAPTQALRERYARLLALLDSPALGPGAGLVGLDDANRGEAAYGAKGRWITAFLRVHAREVLLVVVNLDPTGSWTPSLRLPPAALEAAGLATATSISFAPVFGPARVLSATGAQLAAEGLALDLPPSTALIWRVQDVR